MYIYIYVYIYICTFVYILDVCASLRFGLEIPTRVSVETLCY